MCQICGCGIDPGSQDSMITKNYRCLECGKSFKVLGIALGCQFCGSRNVKRQAGGQQ
ncbi:MAG: hypothetical protein ACE14P_15120 [Methanotrichaceae archaeon]